MNKIMELIHDGRPIRDVLAMAAQMDGVEFKESFAAATDADVTQLGIWTSNTLNVVGMESTLWIGGVLAMYRTATSSKARDELWDKMLAELDISETQAYRAIAVWQRAGRTLFAEPKLVAMFVVEALKLLCGKRVPDAALTAAMNLARDGQRIDIAAAKKLIAVHRPEQPVVKPNAAARVSQAAQSVVDKFSKVSNSFNRCRVFTGRMVRIVLEPSGSPAGCDAKAVIDDLQALIAELQQELDQSTNVSASEPVNV